MLDSFFLQAAVQRLYNRIVPALSQATHALRELNMIAPAIVIIAAKPPTLFKLNTTQVLRCLRTTDIIMA
jgi:hypothetical protein